MNLHFPKNDFLEVTNTYNYNVVLKSGVCGDWKQGIFHGPI